MRFAERGNSVRIARKKAVQLRAWRLGEGSQMERELMAQGKIVLRADGSYELFSQEATGATGQIAAAGDYFKVDSRGCPYPNRRETFAQRHEHIEGDRYLQISKAVPIWMASDPMCEEIEYLLSRGLLHIHPEDAQRYFSAFLWGTQETAAQTAVIVFYEIERDAGGAIRDIDFNFVERSEFERTYELLPETAGAR